MKQKLDLTVEESEGSGRDCGRLRKGGAGNGGGRENDDPSVEKQNTTTFC